MFYLTTGANGSCKTLFTLHDIRKLQLETNRDVYFVEDRFKPLPILTEDFGWIPFKFKDWRELPDGAIIFCDEVHKDLPRRSPSAAIPSHIEDLAEHRSRGFDFFMNTLHPMQIDEFVRRCIGAPGFHRHCKRVFGATNSSTIYLYDAVNPNCEKDGSGKNAQVERRTQPKEVYDWYISSSLHTGKVRVPKQLYTLIGAVIGFIVMGYFAYQQFKPASWDKPKAEAKETSSSSLNPLSAFTGGNNSNGNNANERRPMTTQEYVAAYQPRIPGLMHSAPAYDKLTEPKRVPVPAACIENKTKGCKCYTQDATPYPVDLQLCRQLVKDGAFLAFTPEGERQQQHPPQQSAQQTHQTAPQQPSGLTFIGTPPQATPAAPPPAEPMPQRIASVRR